MCVIGVTLTVPEGAIPEDSAVDIYLAVCQDDRARPKLTGES